MGTLILTIVVLLIYGLVAAYGFQDVFLARRNRETPEDPVLAAWHVAASLFLFVVAGALILGGLLVAYYAIPGLNPPAAIASIQSRLLSLVAGLLSLWLGFRVVAVTRDWLAPKIGGHGRTSRHAR